MMDAGVPMKAHVAGIAMGLIKDANRFAVLTDILGDEEGEAEDGLKADFREEACLDQRSKGDREQEERAPVHHAERILLFHVKRESGRRKPLLLHSPCGRGRSAKKPRPSTGHCLREPERRRREDHDRAQSGGRACPYRA